MALHINQLYHCYNQGNNRETIFKSNDDYILFLHFIRQYIKPKCEILAWCLMPNHFHFLLLTNDESVKEIRVGSLTSQHLSNAYRIMLSSYAQIFNKNNNRNGSLFRQKTKFKQLAEGDTSYDIQLLEYIHLNPVRSGLCVHPTDWLYSSAKDFAGERAGTIASIAVAKKLLDF